MARRVVIIGAVSAVLACGSSAATEGVAAPPSPLPVGAILGVEVSVYPLTMILAEAALGWDERISPRDEALRRADSLLEVALTERAPEVTWVLPDELRRAARTAPGMLTDPDRMATSVFRNNVRKIPDPLWSQMRRLTGVVGDRLALVPASLFFFADSLGGGRAELTVVLAEVRLGEVRWPTVAKGTGDTPWEALEAALETLAPGLPSGGRP